MLQKPYLVKPVRPKKHLGQHFLKETSFAKRLAGAYKFGGKTLEIGPGMGVLTQFLLEKKENLFLVEIDIESVDFLQSEPQFKEVSIFQEDFLRMPLKTKMRLAEKENMGILGNFPYNISSQIFFKVLENRDAVVEVVGMVQKEVGQRIAEGPGTKVYGILSVLLQAFYTIEYLFTVPPGAFNPPPKVDSGVIRLVRKEHYTLNCNEKLFFSVVKVAFNQRRKKLSNALKPLGKFNALHLLDKRAEQLSVEDFIVLTNSYENESTDR